jgi:RHS repeat-associated protein
MKYNIRGWLTQINDTGTLGTDLFAFKINYNDPDPNFQGTALYNGNISQTHWKTSSNNILKSYGYTYDGLNRLLNAKYYAGTDPANTDRYNENLQYDKNGNITSLLRFGSYNTHKQLIDVLNYEYTGNQLLNVNEASNGHNVAGFKDGNLKNNTGLNDYQYDDFGNMIIDRNKGVTNINYNHLNLPRSIIFNENQQTSIHYIYNAAGQKVKKSANLGTNNNISGTSFTDYLGGYQYNNDVLQFFPHAEGYVKHTVNPTNNQSEFDYVYNYKDHLGNIRINYTFDTATSSLRILEEKNYYPFGLKHQENLQARTIRFKQVESTSTFSKGVGFLEPIDIPTFMVNQTVPNSGYQYKYNGKEWQDALNHNVYSFGWRDYDPAIGRFQKLDRFSEKYSNHSPYNYAKNNPVRYREMAGDSIWVTMNTVKDITTFTLHFRGKVFNASDSKIDMNKYASMIQSKLSKAFTGSNGNLKFKSDVQVTAVNSMKDVKKSDHLQVLVDDVTSSSQNLIYNSQGIATYNSKISYVEPYSNLDKITTTGVHELGHNFGLKHSWEDDFSDTDSGGNIMSYGVNRFGSFSNMQLSFIVGEANSGNLNQGSPTQKASTTTNNWMWNTSTNESPYDFNVKKGDIIPTIIKD